MLYKKEGFPQEGEIVLCTVRKISPNSVFVSLDEYRDREGIIHISEIAPGRIRAIRDFVKEGKKIVCTILRANRERNQLDLSLRRVTKSMYIAKSTEIKLEQKAEKILEMLAHQGKITPEQMYKQVGEKLIKTYGSLSMGFNEVFSRGEQVLFDLQVDKTLAKKLTELIQVRMKPAAVSINAVFELKSKAPNGIEVIKRSLKKVIDHTKAKKYEILFKYLGAPRYSATISALDFKAAEAILKEITDILTTSIAKEGGECSISRK